MADNTHRYPTAIAGRYASGDIALLIYRPTCASKVRESEGLRLMSSRSNLLGSTAASIPSPMMARITHCLPYRWKRTLVSLRLFWLWPACARNALEPDWECSITSPLSGRISSLYVPAAQVAPPAANENGTLTSTLFVICAEAETAASSARPIRDAIRFVITSSLSGNGGSLPSRPYFVLHPVWRKLPAKPVTAKKEFHRPYLFSGGPHDLW